MVNAGLAMVDGAGRRRLTVNGAPPIVRLRGRMAGLNPSDIVNAVRDQHGIDVTLLRSCAGNLIEGEVASGALPAGFAWTDQTLDVPPPGRLPWQQPGWLERLRRELDDMPRLGGIAQLVMVRNTSITCLLRLDTGVGVRWLKASLPLFAHEPAVVEWLTAVPGVVTPRVVVRTGDWWIAEDFPEEAQDPQVDFIQTLARVQIASRDGIAELRAIGCPDRPVTGLAAELTPLLDRDDLLTPNQRAALGAAAPALRRAVDDLVTSGIPPSLVHGDLNPENARWTADGWLLFDWTDACVSHPFVDLTRALYPANRATRRRRIRAYAAEWSAVSPPSVVWRAIERVGVVGAAHQAASYLAMLGQAPTGGADRASWSQLRGLLRFWVDQLVSAAHA